MGKESYCVVSPNLRDHEGTFVRVHTGKRNKSLIGEFGLEGTFFSGRES